MTQEQLDLILKYINDSINLHIHTNPYGYDAAERRLKLLREKLDRTVEVQEST